MTILSMDKEEGGCNTHKKSRWDNTQNKEKFLLKGESEALKVCYFHVF